MHRFYSITQIIISIVIIISVLLQAQEGGFGGVWQGGGENYHTRRGLEKVLFYFTIVAVILYIINSLILSIM